MNRIFFDRRITRLAALKVALLATCFMSPAAFAQAEGDEPVAADEPAEAEAESGEITVTALKRNMSAQDTPATVAIVSGDLIARTNITSALDLPAITPGVIIQSAPGALAVASIRGIGSNASNQSFDQSVALFVDGVNDGPAHREEDDVFSLEAQLVVLACFAFDSAEENFCVELDELVRARVGDADHEARHVTIRCDDRFVAEDDCSSWT